MDSLTQIYDRQSDIGTFTDRSALIIGVGGVGSWLAIDLALLGVGTLILVDPDILESSNLNRTLFKLDQTSTMKTQAIKNLIYERRPNCIVLPIEEYFTNQILDKYKVDYIFDCTDNLASRQMILEYFELHEGQLKIPYCKCGYDGFQATISFNDFKSGRWGDDGSYTVVPSFFGTPQILSAITVIEMLMVNSMQEGSTNFNVKKILKKLKKSNEYNE